MDLLRCKTHAYRDTICPVVWSFCLKSVKCTTHSVVLLWMTYVLYPIHFTSSHVFARSDAVIYRRKKNAHHAATQVGL